MGFTIKVSGLLRLEFLGNSSIRSEAIVSYKILLNDSGPKAEPYETPLKISNNYIFYFK